MGLVLGRSIPCGHRQWGNTGLNSDHLGEVSYTCQVSPKCHTPARWRAAKSSTARRSARRRAAVIIEGGWGVEQFVNPPDAGVRADSLSVVLKNTVEESGRGTAASAGIASTDERRKLGALCLGSALPREEALLLGSSRGGLACKYVVHTLYVQRMYGHIRGGEREPGAGRLGGSATLSASPRPGGEVSVENRGDLVLRFLVERIERGQGGG